MRSQSPDQLGHCHWFNSGFPGLHENSHPSLRLVDDNNGKRMYLKGNPGGINAYRETLVANIKNPTLVTNLGIRARVHRVVTSACGKKEAERKKRLLGRVEGPGSNSHLVPNSWAHNINLGLPRALRDMLDSIQNQVLELDVPDTDLPTPLYGPLPLVGLSRRITLEKTAPDTKNSRIGTPQ